MTLDAEILGMDVLDQIMDEADDIAAAMQSYSQFGKFAIGKPRFVKFVNSSPIEIDKEEWLTLGPRGKVVEMNFAVDIQEFREDLDFTYNRRVGVNSKDWFAHWRKSVVEVFGIEAQVEEAGLTGKERKALENDLFRKAMASLSGKYVEIADVPQEPRKNQKPSDTVYKTPELRQVFETREECVAHMTERFGSAPSGAAPAQQSQDAPEGYESHEQFVEVVRMLRESGMANPEIATELNVPILAVVKAK